VVVILEALNCTPLQLLWRFERNMLLSSDGRQVGQLCKLIGVGGKYLNY
jgi:hypothetical protein